MQGSRTPDEKRIEFAAEYLRTGSPRQAAKKTGINERTAYDLAAELDEDPEFTKRRAALHARVLDRAEAAVERAIDILSERIENATEILGGDDEGGPMKVIDKAADYGRSIASLNDSLLKRRKIEDDALARLKGSNPEGGGAVEVIVRMAGPKTETETDGAES